MMNATSRAGLFGKMPRHGDFVRRGLPPGFVAAWDSWISAGLVAAQAALGEAWTTTWGTAPVWRFHLAAGTCGPHAAAGIWRASSDQVGRDFPLTLAAILPPGAGSPGEDWFAALEAAADAACDGALDADALAACLPAASPIPGPPPAAPGCFWRDRAAPRPMPAPSGFRDLLEDRP